MYIRCVQKNNFEASLAARPQEVFARLCDVRAREHCERLGCLPGGGSVKWPFHVVDDDQRRRRGRVDEEQQNPADYGREWHSAPWMSFDPTTFEPSLATNFPNITYLSEDNWVFQVLVRNTCRASRGQDNSQVQAVPSAKARTRSLYPAISPGPQAVCHLACSLGHGAGALCGEGRDIARLSVFVLARFCLAPTSREMFSFASAQ